MDKFKNQMGVYYTKALFLETSVTKGMELFTFKYKDIKVGDKTFISFPKRFIDLRDPTGYLISQDLLDGYQHWKRLEECTWFAEELDKWKEELEVLLKAEALSRIREEAVEGKNSYSANKLLLEGGWIPKEKRKDSVGRPSKEKIKKEAEQLFSNKSEVDADLKRLIN